MLPPRIATRKLIFVAIALHLCTPVCAADRQVTLEFDNADIAQVAQAVASADGKSVLVDPRVKGTLTLGSDKPLPTSEAMRMLQAALRLQGYAMVEDGNVLKVLPEADAKLQGMPIVTGGDGAARGGQIITRVFRLSRESANNLVPVLRPLISNNNTINAYPNNNTIVVTDYADNVKRIGAIIAAVDRGVPGGDVEVLPLENAVASDVAVLLQRMLDGGSSTSVGGNASSGGSSTGGENSLRVTVMAEPRSNSLLIRAPSAERLQQAKSLIERLDRPSKRAGNMYMVPLKNASAVTLAQTLRALVAADGTLSMQQAAGGQSSGATPSSSGSINASYPSMPPLPTSSGTSSSGLGGSSSGSSTGGLGSKGFTTNNNQNLPTTGGTIQADPATNSLLITASEPVYRNLRALIDELDTRRAQVYVESMIVEITSDNAAELGIQWQTQNGRFFGGTNFGTDGQNIVNMGNSTVQGGGILAGLASSLPGAGGLNIGVLSTKLGLNALLRALSKTTGVNILSTPNLMVMDNEEAHIIVGQNLPFVTGSYAQTGSSASVTPFQTIERQDVGLTLRVRPQITDGDSIKMQIYQETSDVISAGGVNGPTTNKRALETSVMADAGDIVVLGGLMQDAYNEGVEKVPGLGDIPLIGGLFRYENKQRKKTNLIVFLRPVIVRTPEAARGVVLTRYDYMRNEGARALTDNWFVRDDDTPQLPDVSQATPTQPLVLGNRRPKVPPRGQSDDSALTLPPPRQSQSPSSHANGEIQ
ncbi:type II secretion system protein GspD [Cupriavidus sp. SHE]|jgi:general secretion pathway protein D|uniref:Type II secretion system protein GspD n=1 Tax=Cupriavidus metallidurans TaxID=119219 RepID=A0A482IS74_9BURK|nr:MULTISPECIES: type II secretion system secretin GspD [Cupriavidus]KWR84276.1 type II secretion system protein GspD [Cupriavidus sp. SHE]QBP09979.1 type II secretion system protein GspD [Cupriavidus metallidurans]